MLTLCRDDTAAAGCDWSAPLTPDAEPKEVHDCINVCVVIALRRRGTVTKPLVIVKFRYLFFEMDGFLERFEVKEQGGTDKIQPDNKPIHWPT